MIIDDNNAAFLKDQIELGNVILFLGAGVNDGATNGSRSPIKSGSDLASLLRTKTRVDDAGLTLGDLVDEFRQQVGDLGFSKLLNEEFSDCTPSLHQRRLLQYAWARIYTLNIDNCLENTPRKDRAQRLQQINRNDPIEEKRNFDTLEIVHLNGYIGALDKGLIFTPSQYRAEIRRSSTWYSKCALDFLDRVFVFIGTRLNEPIFDAHVEELNRLRGALAAKSFLISPDVISPIKQRQLLEKKIEVVQGTLATFVDYLMKAVGPALAPIQIASRISGQPPIEGVSSGILASVETVGSGDFITKYRLNDSGRRRMSRDFFNGIPPDWNIITNEIGVKLAHDAQVHAAVQKLAASDAAAMVVVGQSGSGKSTTLMKAALKFAVESRVRVVSLNESTKERLGDIISYLGISSNGARSFLLINDLVLFSDDVSNIENLLRENRVQILGQCRSRDWEGRLSRNAPKNTILFEMPPLQEADFARLRDGIVEHAVAPRFRTIDDRAKLDFLKKSKRQLLVLMKEATQQRTFEAIIEDEFKSVQGDAARAAFCVVGLATLAKNYLTSGEVQVMLTHINPSFEAAVALSQLEGIVINSAKGLVGRHEIYVRHIFDQMIEAQQLKDSIVGALRFFVPFGQPVISKLGRQRGNFFKFLLNSDWLYDTFGKKKSLVMAERVYSSVELEYQQDGHYWLQRGLFYRRDRKHSVARDHLDKSVGAYPGNTYARHALAQQKLIGAALEPRGGASFDRDMREAVAELNLQAEQRGVSDEYALVTLARFHPEVFVQRNDMEAAKGVAREYFERLSALSKALPRPERSVSDALATCLKLATTGEWRSPRY